MNITVFPASSPLLSLSRKRHTYDSESPNHSGFRLAECMYVSQPYKVLAGAGLYPAPHPLAVLPVFCTEFLGENPLFGNNLKTRYPGDEKHHPEHSLHLPQPHRPPGKDAGHAQVHGVAA